MKKIKKAILPVFFGFTMAVITVVIAACAMPSEQDSSNRETRLIVGMYATPSGGVQALMNALEIDVPDMNEGIAALGNSHAIEGIEALILDVK